MDYKLGMELEYKRLLSFYGKPIEVALDRDTVVVRTLDGEVITRAWQGNWQYDKLIHHVGHDVNIAVYGDGANVAIVCDECYEVLIDFDFDSEEE